MKTNESDKICCQKVMLTVDDPRLKNCKKYEMGNGMNSLRNEEGDFYLLNSKTGVVRQISTAGGKVLVDDQEIDWEAVERNCENGLYNAKNKELNYGAMSRWDYFKDGICVLCWTLYPDGEYFMDSDGFGMEDNAEETIYGVIDTDLNFVEPFRPVRHVEAYFKQLRAARGK